MISPAFIEANYEVLESFLRKRRRRICNEDLRTKLEYFSEEYDKEREMEPRPARARETTLVLCTKSLTVQRQRERVVELEDAPNRDGAGVHQTLVNTGGNLLPNGTHLSHNAQPFMPNSFQPSNRPIPTYVDPYPQPNMGVAYGQPLSYPSYTQGGNTNFGGTSAYHSYGGYAPHAPTSSNILTSNRFMPFRILHWLRDPICPLDQGLPCTRRAKNAFSCGSYDGKGDPDNYLLLFQGAIRMQKWAMPVVCHMFTYTFKDSTQIWWNCEKAGSILNYEDLKAKFQSLFSQQKKFTKTHLAVHNINQREGESTRAFVTMYTDDTLQILGLHAEHRIFRFVHGLKTRSLMEFLSTYLPPTHKGLIEKTYTCIKAREVATNGILNDHQEGFDRFNKKYSWDNNKGKKNRDRFSPYHSSNHGLLSNLSKSPRKILETKKVAKTFKQPPRLVGSRLSRDMSKYCHFHEDHGHDTNQCRKLRHQIKESLKSGQLAHLVKGIKKGKAKVSDTQLGANNSSDPFIIKVQVFGRSLRVDSKVPLVGFLREHSWPLDEVPLEITIGESPFARTEVLNFVIVSYADNEERVVVNDKYPKQTIVIGKQLPPSFKKKLWDLLKSNTDVFAWTCSYMTGIPRTIMIGGNPFNTEYWLNEFKHIEPVKQKKRGLTPEQNEAICKEVEELRKANIL
ncbi:reverse transcriptase domain-containing protein [Tanacetum coccineum]|uniref:Reverse transcriptase domain-containing protein n=1 Tax=Tanacetum coccineum TaxID=301880 RepID=A0ABQ5CTJ4_9ASTR